MTDSIIRADAILSARRPGVTASSLRAGTEQSLRSVYSLGHSAIASLPGSLHSITEEAVTPFTLACFLIIIVEFGERFNYYTTKILYGSYCTQMLNMTSSEYAIFLNFNDFFNYGTGIIGAYIADAFLGRFKTICASAPIYVAGLVLLTVSATPLGYGDWPYYPDSNGGWAYPAFWASVTIMAIGCGFIKPCVSVFAAEQLKDEHGNDASPRTLERLYMWWYQCINVGGFIGPLVSLLLLAVLLDSDLPLLRSLSFTRSRPCSQEARPPASTTSSAKSTSAPQTPPWFPLVTSIALAAAS